RDLHAFPARRSSDLPILLRIIQVFIGKLQTALYMCFLEQGDLASSAVLQTITALCGDCGPSCLEIIHKLPLCSSGVILHLSDDHRYRTRGYLAWSPRPRAIDSCFHLRIITPIVVCFSPSCLPMVLYTIQTLY